MSKNALDDSEKIIAQQIQLLATKSNLGELEESAVRSLEVLVRTKLLLQKAFNSEDNALSELSVDELKNIISASNPKESSRSDFGLEPQTEVSILNPGLVPDKAPTPEDVND